MSPKPEKTFSLAEANILLPRVAEITSETVLRLEQIRQESGIGQGGESSLPEGVLEEIQETLSAWSAGIQELGAQPKGFFTVDFPSPDPELLYCWTYGEERISYTHKVWENFSHRRPLSSAEPMNDHLRWVN